MILCVHEYVLYTMYTYKVIPHIRTQTVSKVFIFDFIRMYYYYYYYYRHSCNKTNNYTNACVREGGYCVYAYYIDVGKLEIDTYHLTELYYLHVLENVSPSYLYVLRDNNIFKIIISPKMSSQFKCKLVHNSADRHSYCSLKPNNDFVIMHISPATRLTHLQLFINSHCL